MRRDEAIPVVSAIFGPARLYTLEDDSVFSKHMDPYFGEMLVAWIARFANSALAHACMCCVVIILPDASQFIL